MEKKKEPASLSIVSLASSEEIQALKWVNLPPAAWTIISLSTFFVFEEIVLFLTEKLNENDLIYLVLSRLTVNSSHLFVCGSIF